MCVLTHCFDLPFCTDPNPIFMKAEDLLMRLNKKILLAVASYAFKSVKLEEVSSSGFEEGASSVFAYCSCSVSVLLDEVSFGFFFLITLASDFFFRIRSLFANQCVM